MCRITVAHFLVFHQWLMRILPISSISTKKLWQLLLGPKYPLTDQQIYLLQHSKKSDHIQVVTQYPVSINQKIAACLEIGKRSYQNFQQSPYLTSPLAIYQYTREMIHAPQEIVRALYLNSQLQILGDEIVAMGSLNTAQINARELLRPAISYNAHAFVIVHNHPAGDPTASPDDCRLTKYIATIGTMINIPLQDHIIIATSGYVSLRSEYPQLFEANV